MQARINIRLLFDIISCNKVVINSKPSEDEFPVPSDMGPQPQVPAMHGCSNTEPVGGRGRPLFLQEDKVATVSSVGFSGRQSAKE
jgi:hypothetical protein